MNTDLQQLMTTKINHYQKCIYSIHFVYSNKITLSVEKHVQNSVGMQNNDLFALFKTFFYDEAKGRFTGQGKRDRLSGQYIDGDLVLTCVCWAWNIFHATP